MMRHLRQTTVTPECAFSLIQPVCLDPPNKISTHIPPYYSPQQQKYTLKRSQTNLYNYIVIIHINLEDLVSFNLLFKHENSEKM